MTQVQTATVSSVPVRSVCGFVVANTGGDQNGPAIIKGAGSTWAFADNHNIPGGYGIFFRTIAPKRKAGNLTTQPWYGDQATCRTTHHDCGYQGAWGALALDLVSVTGPLGPNAEGSKEMAPRAGSNRGGSEPRRGPRHPPLRRPRSIGRGPAPLPLLRFGSGLRIAERSVPATNRSSRASRSESGRSAQEVRTKAMDAGIVWWTR